MKAHRSLNDSQAERIERAIDGVMTDQEWADFQAEVVRDAALRTAYVDRAALHAQLRAERHTLIELLEEKPAVVEATGRSWRFAAGIAALAASVAFAAGFLFLPARAGKPTVATLIEAQNCKWAGSDLPTIGSRGLRPSDLKAARR
jgi:anti-sigma-K factor RskA